MTKKAVSAEEINQWLVAEEERLGRTQEQLRFLSEATLEYPDWVCDIDDAKMCLALSLAKINPASIKTEHVNNIRRLFKDSKDPVFLEKQLKVGKENSKISQLSWILGALQITTTGLSLAYSLPFPLVMGITLFSMTVANVAHVGVFRKDIDIILLSKEINDTKLTESLGIFNEIGVSGEKENLDWREIKQNFRHWPETKQYLKKLKSELKVLQEGQGARIEIAAHEAIGRTKDVWLRENWQYLTALELLEEIAGSVADQKIETLRQRVSASSIPKHGILGTNINAAALEEKSTKRISHKGKNGFKSAL